MKGQHDDGNIPRLDRVHSRSCSFLDQCCGEEDIGHRGVGVNAMRYCHSAFLP